MASIRNYTISSPPEHRDHLELTIKREEGGFFSQYMHDDLKPGDTVEIQGPFGTFTSAGEADGVVLIAGGVGITPFLSIIRHLTAAAWPGAIDLLHAVRSPADAIRAEELERLAREHPRLRIHMFYSEEGLGGSKTGIGRITASAIRDRVPGIATRPVYLCGPTAMMRAVADMLRECGVPTTSLFVESFGEALTSDQDIAATVAR